MKKIIFFLIILCTIIINCYKVEAKTYNFYEAEMIDDVYLIRYEESTKTKYYQKARFFREKESKDLAYCIDAFITFNEEANYSTKTPNLSSKQIDRLSKIAHFGYKYKNHTDKVWYAVTQVMIWKELEGDNNIYFTDTLNGNKTNKYDSYIKEINNLINDNSKIPSFSNKEITIVEGNEYILNDTNKILNEYTNDRNITIKDNNLIINNLKQGNYTINLNRKDNSYNEPVLFYLANNTQTLLKTGNLSNLNTKLSVNVINTSIILNKVDKNNSSFTPSGDASLIGSTFEIRNSKDELIDTVEIDETGKSIISNIPLDKYTIKEIKSGPGYNINNNEYEITIDENNPNKELTIENEVIKKKIIIHKTYGKKDSQIPEPNIQFNIYNSKNEFIKTITTDKSGNAEIILPYGNYTIKQLTTTEGYEFSDPIIIDVKDDKEQKISLSDLKIEVPNTSKYNNIFIIILLLLLI